MPHPFTIHDSLKFSHLFGMLFTSHAVKLITHQAKIHATYHPPGMYLYIFQISHYLGILFSQISCQGNIPHGQTVINEQVNVTNYVEM